MENVTSAKLVVLGGALAGEVFALERDSVTFGRELANTICCPDPSLSRRHCEFVRTEDAWTLRDLTSANGTFVNGAKVVSHRLVEGDRILLGDSVVLLYVTEPRRHTAIVDEADTPVEPTVRVAIDDTVYLQ